MNTKHGLHSGEGRYSICIRRSGQEMFEGVGKTIRREKSIFGKREGDAGQFAKLQCWVITFSNITKGRDELYSVNASDLKGMGIGILMTDPIYRSPSLSNMFAEGLSLQNFPVCDIVCFQ